MSPQRHYTWAFRVGLIALLCGITLVGWGFFGRTPDGRFRLDALAEKIAAVGVPNGVAHFLLWMLAVTFIGACFGTAMASFCHMVSAECPACGGSARWDSVNSIAYQCGACGKRHDTRIHWGEEVDAEQSGQPEPPTARGLKP